MGHEPLRQCALCRKKFLKTELLRVVRYEGSFSLDTTHKKDGRGAYICDECKSSDDLYKKKVLDRAFREKVPDKIYDLLKGE